MLKIFIYVILYCTTFYIFLYRVKNSSQTNFFESPSYLIKIVQYVLWNYKNPPQNEADFMVFYPVLFAIIHKLICVFNLICAVCFSSLLYFYIILSGICFPVCGSVSTAYSYLLIRINSLSASYFL